MIERITGFSVTPKLTLCAVTLLLLPTLAVAQNAQPAGAPATDPQPASAVSPQKARAVPPEITYAGGQLRIQALDSTLADILARVAAVTGVTIDIPESARNERLPVVELGPGSPRQVLASLLSGSSLDYIIQASDTESENIHAVLLLTREKKGGRNNGMDAAVPMHSPFARGFARPVQGETAPDPPARAEVASAEPPPPPEDPPPSPVGSEQPRPGLEPAQANAANQAHLQPPPMNPQAINQQLQQMYQQRMQMVQQDRAGLAPAGSASSGSK